MGIEDDSPDHPRIAADIRKTSSGIEAKDHDPALDQETECFCSSVLPAYLSDADLKTGSFWSDTARLHEAPA